MKEELSDLMKQAQKMQDNLKNIQDELSGIGVEGEAGAGLVKVHLTCRYSCTKVEINPSVLEGGDQEMLEELIATAFNDATSKVEKAVQEKMMGLTQGFSMPNDMSSLSL